jgi:hypothetical protein
MQWIKEHPWIAAIGGLAVFLFVYILRSGGSSSGSSGGTTYVSSGPSDAVQQAGIAASAQTAQAQAAATVAAQQTQAQYNVAVLDQQNKQQQNDIAGSVALEQERDALSVANLQYSSATAINDSNNAAAVRQADIGANAQADIADTAAKTQAAIAGVNAAASVSINNQNQHTQQAQINAASAAFEHQLETEAAIAAGNQGVVNAQTAADLAKVGIAGGVAEYNTNAAVVNNQNVIAGTVAINQANANAATQISGQQTAGQVSTIQSLINSINSGVFNKGGSGGTNQVSAISAVLGQPAIGVAAQQAGAAIATTPPWYTGILNTVAKGLVAAA